MESCVCSSRFACCAEFPQRACVGMSVAHEDGLEEDGGGGNVSRTARPPGAAGAKDVRNSNEVAFRERDQIPANTS